MIYDLLSRKDLRVRNLAAWPNTCHRIPSAHQVRIRAPSALRWFKDELRRQPSVAPDDGTLETGLQTAASGATLLQVSPSSLAAAVRAAIKSTSMPRRLACLDHTHTVKFRAELWRPKA